MGYETISATDHEEWEERGLKGFGDIADLVEYRNERETGYGDSEGDWFATDRDKLVIYRGTHGNDHSPGASGYTYADIYDNRDEFNRAEAALEALPEDIEEEEEEESEDPDGGPEKLDEFTSAYIDAALYYSTDDGVPIDRDHDASDIDPESLAAMKADCKAFQDENRKWIAGKERRAGIDFWLTRNRHGAGFWDGDWPDPAATTLTDAAHAYGEVNLTIGDDGRIYQS